MSETKEFNISVNSIDPENRFPRLLTAVSQLTNKIYSSESFNEFCQSAVSLWNEINCSEQSPASEKFQRLSSELEARQDGTIPTIWGGVVVTEHQHPKVSKYLVVRSGKYLALEKHSVKEESLRVESGIGLLLEGVEDSVLQARILTEGDVASFAPGVEHCLISFDNLLVFEESLDHKGMDQDLIFIFEPV